MARPPLPERPRAEWLLSQGRTVGEVAAELGIAERTVSRWAATLPDDVPFAPATPEPPPRAEPPTRLRLVARERASTPTGDGQDEDEMVEAAIGLGWSARVRRGLIERLGLTPDEVDALRVRVLERTGAALSRAPLVQVAEFTLRLRHAQGVALRQADLGALTRLLSLEGRVLGMDRLRVDVDGPVEHFVVMPSSVVDI